jgi:hypothetical protein
MTHLANSACKLSSLTLILLSIVGFAPLVSASRGLAQQGAASPKRAARLS